MNILAIYIYNDVPTWKLYEDFDYFLEELKTNKLLKEAIINNKCQLFTSSENMVTPLIITEIKKDIDIEFIDTDLSAEHEGMIGYTEEEEE